MVSKEKIVKGSIIWIILSMISFVSCKGLMTKTQWENLPDKKIHAKGLIISIVDKVGDRSIDISSDKKLLYKIMKSIPVDATIKKVENRYGVTIDSTDMKKYLSGLTEENVTEFWRSSVDSKRNLYIELKIALMVWKKGDIGGAVNTLNLFGEAGGAVAAVVDIMSDDYYTVGYSYRCSLMIDSNLMPQGQLGICDNGFPSKDVPVINVVKGKVEGFPRFGGEEIKKAIRKNMKSYILKNIMKRKIPKRLQAYSQPWDSEGKDEVESCVDLEKKLSGQLK